MRTFRVLVLVLLPIPGLVSCSFEKTVIPKSSATISGHAAYVTDTDEQEGKYGIFTYETAELEDEWDYGGRVEYFFADNVAVSASQTMGEHDFLSTDGDELGKVDLAFRTLELKAYSGWKMKDPSGGGYFGFGLAHADFDEQATNVDSLDFEDSLGFTISGGVLQFIDPSKRVFADIGFRASLINSEVGITDGGSSAEADLDMLTVIAPIVSLGFRF